MQADFVNESYGEENNKLFFDAQTLMQSGLAETVARAMPHLAPQIEEAAAAGGMVEMTRGDFHAFLPQEAQHHLANIARMSPDAFSAAEAAAWEETEAAAEFEETAKRAHADAEARLARQQEFDGLKARFKQELAATGRMNAQNADDAASVWASHIQSYAGRLNMTPDEFMGRYGRLNVVGESLTQDGVFSQALASAPPKGWVHVADGAEAAALWNGTSDAQAVFWDMPQGKLAHDVPALAGYSSVSVDKNAVNHIRKNHGDAKSEQSRGQIAISDGDIARIPEVVGNYDDIRVADIDGTHNKRVIFAKRFDDGLVVYVAESSVRKKDLKAVSMWKYPQSANAQDVLNHAMSLYPNAQNGRGRIPHDGNDTTVAPLFQDMTAEQAQFEETEAAYGGREAYEAAKAEGRTELDYRQWVQVRTPAFKEWFGDWENDAANASKVVNPKTGEPLVVYHETDNQFTVFDTGRGGHQKNDFETPTGIFTKSSGEKIGLGNIQMPLFANIRNPLAFGDRVEILAFLQRNVPGFSQLHDEFADVDVSFADKLAEAESRDDALLDALLAGVEDTGLRGEILDDFDSRSEASKLLNEWDGYSDNLAQQMRRLFDDYVRQNGYDGMFVERDKGSFGRETDALIALMPNQIKSATANSGAFSAGKDSILYQSVYEDALDKMERAFQKMGIQTTRDGSHKSQSQYLYAYVDDMDSDEPRYVKFRASDHELPAYYKDGSAEVNYDIKAGNKSDHSSGDDWAEAVKWFADTYGFDVPPSVKAAFTKRANSRSIDTQTKNRVAYTKEKLAELDKIEKDDSITYERSPNGKQAIFRDKKGKQVSPLNLRLPTGKQKPTKQEQIDALREVRLSELAELEQSLLHQDARGMFDRMADTIALLKNADASTFIHEFGHFELETMSRIERDLRGMPASELSEGERQILADFQTTLDWFGVKDGDAWAAMTLDGQREHHEKFARGMEAYLFEGKAPSEALRGVFSRVARLLKRIYRTLAGLNVELSDDIREVFGRLLASDEQIAEAGYVNGMKLLLDGDAELRAMDEAARREAEDELGRRALRDMAFARNARNREIRRLKKEYKADFARAEMAARGSIMKQPVYRAWQLFTAKMTDEDRIDGNSKAEREFGRKAKVLQGKPVYTIEKRTAPTDNKELRDWAADLFEKAGGKAVNPEIGEVALTRKSVKDSMAHGMNPFKAAAFEAVPFVIENGVVVAKADHDRLTSFFVSAPVRIMGEEDIVTVLVHKDMNTQKMYLHSVIAKENLLKTAPLIESTADTPVSEPRGGLYSGGLPNQALTGLDGDSAADTGVSEPRGKPNAEVLPTGKLQSEDVASVLSKLLAYKPKTDRTALDPSSDTLMTAIAKLGGLNKDEVVREWGLDPKDKIPTPVFGMPVLRRTKGRSIDAMVEVLAEAGYLPVDSHGKADVRDLEERFSDGLKGQDWYSRHYVPREEKKAGEAVANPYALNAVRLDEASLDGLSADWAQVLQERGMTAKKGGMHPDIAAGLILDENGEPVFSDGLDLVQALVEALPPQEAIEDTARLNLLAEKGEVPTQADFEEAADLAVHNEMRARLIAGELNRLKASLGSVSLLKQAARVAAKERVEQMKTRDLRPSVFTRAEAAAAKSSEKAFKAGDTEAAAAHKRNQLIQNALARETLKAREEMEKTRRYLAKFDRVAKGVDIEYREQIEALLEDVELRQISLKETDRRKSAYQFVREMEEAGIQHSIDPEYVDTISRKSWRDMTVEEMRGLADTVRQLEHLGRLKNRLLSGQEKRSYEAVRDLLDATLDASAKAQHRKAQERREAATGLQKAGALLRGGYWAHLKTATIVRMFDNGQDGGAFFTHFLLPLKQAADKEAAMQAEVSEKLYEVLKPLAKHTGRLKNRIGGKTHYQGLGELTREQLFAVALNMGNAGNIQRLLDGEGWRMEDVQRALSSALTAQEWQVVQGVWDLLESYRPQIAALERRMTGVEPEWVAARPFKIMSADGVEVELRGGYYPAKYDREGSGAAEKNEATTDAKAQTAAAGLAAATRRTFTKQRANEVKGRPLRLSLNVAYDAFNEIIHDLTHREAIADANRLLNSHTLDTKIRQYYGADAKRQLSRAIADIAQGNSGAAQALDGWAGRLRQNVSVAGLGFNIVSAALQLTGWIPAVTRVGFANTAKALTTYAAHPIAATRAANEMSVMMANRSRTRFRELNDVANSVNGQNGVKAFVRRYAYWLMMRMQQVTDTIVWHGAMMKAMDAGRSEAEAVQLADQTVLDTQGGGQTKDLSAVERGGNLQKLFTVFYAYMNTALNMGAASIATQRGKGRLAAELMLIWVIPTALNAVMKSLLTPGDDDDDLAKKLAKEQISFTLGMFVGGRELVQLGDIATGGKFYGYNGPAGLRPIADTYKFAQQAQQGGFDKGLATATINILGSGFGLPSAQISRTLKGAQALDEGKTDNPAALLFGYDGKK
ncbi:hypothetical protein HMPREF9123_1350 [Neisseria bacilliformis ATCC BAA-1200]|uniref:Phage MuF C-terminal domain-containing protein n=1 Tax=Neisseria bacilliformis ATCC BAA-1200 TaxID=888742 RepID=F2BCC2_9NEIS|nr:hypothetical protein [Neisseria bacilliformis]EGF10879.1 hypothetical protein HMPREF9123_1350 [Neisseria bacilliformis ATCC BAA-1200]QMT48372.1 hypothetical protein H3L91_04480 [Neisseria bacilliformis]